jgi:hypothetical protein
MTLLLTPFASALAGLIGVLLGGWLSGRHERKRREAEFTSRRLSEFYGPILSIRTEIKARSELRLRVQTAAQEEWTKFVNPSKAQTQVQNTTH